MSKMIVRIWTTGALVTCLFGAGVFTLLLFTFLRFRSPLVLASLIANTGALLILISDFSRIVPGIRLVLNDPPIGYMFLSVFGVGFLTFGVLYLAVVLTEPDRHLTYLPSILAVSIVSALVMAVGQYFGFPPIIAISYIIEIASASFAAVFVLVKRGRILDRRLCRFSCIVGIAVIIAAPLELLRVYLWNRSVSPFGNSLPPFLLLVFLLITNGAVLIISRQRLTRVSNRPAGELDVEAVSYFELTPRECDIVMCIFSGCSNEEIGSRLFISTNTVKNHIYHIYQKTGVRNRVELLNSVISNTEAG